MRQTTNGSANTPVRTKTSLKLDEAQKNESNLDAFYKSAKRNKEILLYRTQKTKSLFTASQSPKKKQNRNTHTPLNH
jgi:hypothetical protein